MPTYKLIYFNLIGRGETIRMIFKMAGVDFEDFRIERDQFTPEMKADTPFGQLPVLEVDGVKLCQSNACARYLARKYNLAGKTDLEQAQVDMVADCFEDTIKPMIACFTETDETRKAEAKKKYAEEQLPAFLKLLERLLTANHDGDKFFVGEEVTWVDLQFLSFIIWLKHTDVENPLADFPKLTALKARVESIPQIAEWIEQRPKTEH
jgi:glutathione S-transferase